MLINSRALTRFVRNCVNSCDQTAWKFNVSLRITGYRLTVLDRSTSFINCFETFASLFSFFEGNSSELRESLRGGRGLINGGDQSSERMYNSAETNLLITYHFFAITRPVRIIRTSFHGDGNKLAVSEKLEEVLCCSFGLRV